MNETERENGQVRRKEILQYITDYMLNHGYSPSVQDICDGVGLRSKSSVHSHLITMLKLGMIETDALNGTPRAIRIPGYRLVKVEEKHGGEQQCT